MEQWKNKILNSVDGMQKATPDPDLFLKIKAQIENQTPVVIKENKWAWVSVAAAVVFIVVSNLLVIGNHVENEEVSGGQSTLGVSVSRDYNIYQL